MGPLTKDERKAKLLKYLEKKKKRVFEYKVMYESRKRVADKRPRFKGRFIAEENLPSFL